MADKVCAKCSSQIEVGETWSMWCVQKVTVR